MSRRRFASLERLYGLEGAARLQAAHAMVIGIGGVGSWAAEALARSGVGRITLVDMDHVAESNINRQIHATDASLGMAKVEAMRQRIASYAPHCQVDVVDDFVEPENWPTICAQAQAAQPLQAVIDCCDQLKTKLALATWSRHKAVRGQCLFISVGAAGGKRRADKVEVADLRDVSHDPLLAGLRAQWRRQQRAGQAAAPQSATQQSKPSAKKFGVNCVFSREPVAPPHPSCGLDGNTAPGAGGHALNCAGYGSAVSVTATFGMVAAGWVIDALSA